MTQRMRNSSKSQTHMMRFRVLNRGESTTNTVTKGSRSTDRAKGEAGAHMIRSTYSPASSAAEVISATEAGNGAGQTWRCESAYHSAISIPAMSTASRWKSSIYVRHAKAAAAPTAQWIHAGNVEAGG